MGSWRTYDRATSITLRLEELCHRYRLSLSFRINLLAWITSNAVPEGTFTPNRMYAEVLPLIIFALIATLPALLFAIISEVIRANLLWESLVADVLTGIVNSLLVSAVSLFVGDLRTLEDIFEGKRMFDICCWLAPNYVIDVLA